MISDESRVQKMGQLFAKADPPYIYIQLATEPATDIDYSWLARLAPGTYLESIRDPLLHIIGPNRP